MKDEVVMFGQRSLILTFMNSDVCAVTYNMCLPMLVPSKQLANGTNEPLGFAYEVAHPSP